MTSDDLKSMLMQTPVGFAILTGPGWVFELANQPYLEMVDRTNIVGKPWAQVFPELVGTPTEAVVRSVYEKGDTIKVTEFPVPLKRGGRAHEGFFSFTLHPMRDGRGATTGFVVIAVEVTELVMQRRAAEAMADQLKASEERFRGAQETSLDAFLSLRSIRDEKGRVCDFEILFQNEAGTKVNGLVSEQVRGSRMLQHFPELPKSPLWALYLETAETGKPFRTEIPYQQDGFDSWFRILCSRVGEGIAISFSDIREQKQLEQAEKKAREQAEFLAADVLRQSREMEKALVELSSARDRAEARVRELEAELKRARSVTG